MRRGDKSLKENLDETITNIDNLLQNDNAVYLDFDLVKIYFNNLSSIIEYLFNPLLAPQYVLMNHYIDIKEKITNRKNQIAEEVKQARSPRKEFLQSMLAYYTQIDREKLLKIGRALQESNVSLDGEPSRTTTSKTVLVQINHNDSDAQAKLEGKERNKVVKKNSP